MLLHITLFVGSFLVGYVSGVLYQAMKASGVSPRDIITGSSFLHKKQATIVDMDDPLDIDLGEEEIK